jgi:tripartite-type tricarboxylate transporter receptor subunit TctC
VAEFYQGKTVRVVIGTAPGGGYDTYARFVAQHIRKHIPGGPTVIAENLPGAGSLVAMNQIYTSLPKDGTIIGHVIGQNAGTEQMFGQTVQFDLTKVGHLGAPVRDEFILLTPKSTGVTRIDDIIGPNAKEFAVGSTAPVGDPNSAVAGYFNSLFGAKIRNVTGYAGTAPIRVAMERGEVDGFVQSWSSHKVTSMDKTDSGEWLILLQVGVEQIVGVPATVPTIKDVAKTPEQQLLGRLVALPGEFSRPFFVAPEVPADRTAALRQAFMKTLADPEFLADAAKANLEINPISADRMLSLITEFMSTPEETRAQLKPILAPSP